MEEKKDQDLFSSFAILVTILIIAGTIYFVVNRQSQSGGQDATTAPSTGNVATAPSTAPTTPPAGTPADISKVNTVNEPFIGDPKAPVTMAFWFDYQCTFCKQFEDTTMPSIMSDYVKTGKVKIVLKDFPFLGPDSQSAALVARAVWAASPSKFADWYTEMFVKQDGENSGWGSQSDILAMTKTIPGIDEAKVEQLLAANSAQYQQAIDADKAEGSSFGVNGTPAFIIGKQLSVGAQPYSAIKPLIDAALAGK